MLPPIAALVKLRVNLLSSSLMSISGMMIGSDARASCRRDDMDTDSPLFSSATIVTSLEDKLMPTSALGSCLTFLTLVNGVFGTPLETRVLEP